MSAPLPEPITLDFNDASLIPFLSGQPPGGSDVLTTQSACPFKAFATTRLAARGWDFAAAGLTPSQRGQLLHAVLHSVWACPPLGMRSLTELGGEISTGLRPFVAFHADRAIPGTLALSVRERMPARYLELEAERLTRLVTEWRLSAC